MQIDNNKHYDIVIVGAGMAGTCLALGLAKLDLNILLIDKFPPNHQQQPSFDDRAIAVNLASIQVLKFIGMWQHVQHQTQPIEKIHISNRGRTGFTRLSSQSFGLQAFGHVVENRVIGERGHEQIRKHANIEFVSPATVTEITQNCPHQGIELIICDNKSQQSMRVKARWLVAADGIQSSIRQLCEDSVEHKSYHTQALVTNISTQAPHKNRAFERFTDDGPLALLPMTEDRVSVVWALQKEKAAELMQAEPNILRHALQKAFGYRLGKINKVGQCQSYPLQMTINQTHSNYRVIYVANAAQALHPIAGQGFNIGLRDIAVLIETISHAQNQNNLDTIGDIEVAERYSRHRRIDQDLLTKATDSMVAIFSNSYPLLTESRNAALNFLDLCQAAKKEAIDFFIGANGQLPAYYWQDCFDYTPKTNPKYA